MSTLKRLTLLAVVFCSFLKFTSANQVKVARDIYYYEAPYETDLFVDSKTFPLDESKGNLTFVTCPKGYHHTLEKNCTVVLVAMGTRSDRRSCPVTLKTNKSLHFTEYLEVIRFAPANAAIIWGEFNQTIKPDPNYRSGKILIRCTVVDMNTCNNRQLELQSSVNYTTYLSQVAGSKYVVYGDSLEIIIENADDPKHLNKYKIDAGGNFVSKSEPWTAKPASDIFLPIVADSKLKGYLHNDNGLDGERRLYMLNADSDGSEKLLKKFHRDLIYQDISTAHHTIGVASGGNFFNVEKNSSVGRVDVFQFDQDGHLKLNTTFNTWICIQYLELHNLAAGGFILLIGGCDEAICDRPEFYIQKFVNDGTVIGSSKFPGTDSCKDYLTIRVFEKEPKEYCVAYLCSNARSFNNPSIIREKQFVDLLVNCYTDED